MTGTNQLVRKQLECSTTNPLTCDHCLTQLGVGEKAVVFNAGAKHGLVTLCRYCISGINHVAQFGLSTIAEELGMSHPPPRWLFEIWRQAGYSRMNMPPVHQLQILSVGPMEWRQSVVAAIQMGIVRGELLRFIRRLLVVCP